MPRSLALVSDMGALHGPPGPGHPALARNFTAGNWQVWHKMIGPSLPNRHECVLLSISQVPWCDETLGQSEMNRDGIRLIDNQFLTVPFL